ncbi:MAG: 7-carboxy-7-deazaguanine synthase QueE [Synechococcaceae cyanobacterium]|nr:7-carboxy-7-deazaguanine synthase QueE [Synechococcaceae cyanobacterium]
MTEPDTLPRNTELSLPVVETFHSLQGEGVHAGRSAFFLRLAGCNVGCSWCDTRHSWELQAHPRRSLAELTEEVAEAAAAGAAFAVLTGGEPLEHDLGPLCDALAVAVPALPLHLETSGAAPVALSGRFAWITLSPKRHRPPTPVLLAACDELKVVVHEPADLAFAEAMAVQALAARAALPPGSAGHPPDAVAPAGVASGCGPVLLLQPGWNCRRGQELAIAHVQAHPAWRLSLQSHKWLGVR